MTVHLIHGYNVFDGGYGTVGRLRPFIEGSKVCHDNGFTGLPKTKNSRNHAIEKIRSQLEPGDFIICHSNAALMVHELTQSHAEILAGVVLINPALHRDINWAKKLPTLCLHNHEDWSVHFGLSWRMAACRHGLDQGNLAFSAVRNLDTGEFWWGRPATGHAGVFKDKNVGFWGRVINQWIKHLLDMSEPDI